MVAGKLLVFGFEKMLKTVSASPNKLNSLSDTQHLGVWSVSLASVVDEFPLFEEREKKERFLLVLGLLASRTITLDKAAEVLGMSKSEFSTVLKTIGFKYSFLDEQELKKEAAASRNFLKKKRCG